MNAAKNRKEQLYQDLKRKILTLELAPGKNLDEVALSKEYEISRTPLREVFRALAGEGYLMIRSNRGTQVASMDYKVLRDFFLVAPMIYAAVSRLAAQNATAIQIKRLQKAQLKFLKAVADDKLHKMVFYNDLFHSIVGEMANNIFLDPTLRRLLIDHARIAQTFYRVENEDMRDDLSAAARQHDQMIEAFKNRDEETAEKLAIAHWELSRKQIERFVTPESFEISLDQ